MKLFRNYMSVGFTNFRRNHLTMGFHKNPDKITKIEIKIIDINLNL
jgi:hypothetical protein